MAAAAHLGDRSAFNNSTTPITRRNRPQSTGAAPSVSRSRRSPSLGRGFRTSPVWCNRSSGTKPYHFYGVSMALGKQAKIINDRQVRAVLAELATRRYPLRDRVMFLLSLKAGMRAVEISRCTWAMVTNSESQIGDVIALQNCASKGRGGGRIMPITRTLRQRLWLCIES